MLCHERIPPILHILSKWIETNDLSDFNLPFHLEIPILCSNLGQDDYIWQRRLNIQWPKHPADPTDSVWGTGAQTIQNSHQIPKTQQGNYKKTIGGTIHRYSVLYTLYMGQMTNCQWPIIKEQLVVCTKLICF